MAVAHTLIRKRRAVSLKLGTSRYVVREKGAVVRRKLTATGMRLLKKRKSMSATVTVKVVWDATPTTRKINDGGRGSTFRLSQPTKRRSSPSMAVDNRRLAVEGAPVTPGHSSVQ